MRLDICSELIPKVRRTIDEVAHDAIEDFSTDLNAEILNAIIMAAQKMKRELGRQFLEPLAASGQTITPLEEGIGTISLPDDYGELVEFKMKGFLQPVTELMEPGSDEAKLQIHPWTRGSYSKPKAEMALDDNGKNVIKYYSIPKSINGYSHALDHFHYMPVIDDDTRYLPIVDDMYDTLVYESAAILMLSKGETNLASQFASMYASKTATQVETPETA